jgi:2-polyprenyl-3-methyl-5-hydroxy-6-metoxy-1,4-benzoquinol methylase
MNEREYDRMYRVEDRHWWYVALHELISGYVAREWQRHGELRLLDAGCGTGRLCQLLSRFGTVAGCDMSDRALSFCAARGIGSAFKADLNTVDLGEGRYDVITSIDVLYHQAVADDGAVLAKLARALRPGGLLILNLPAFPFLYSTHDIAVKTRRRYRRRALVALASQAGLQVESATYRLGLLFLPILALRLGKRLFTPSAHEQEVQSDVYPPPAAVNWALLRLLRGENRILRHCPLPFGTSLFVTARRPTG